MWLLGPTVNLGFIAIQTTGALVLLALLVAYGLLAMEGRRRPGPGLATADALLWHATLAAFAASRLPALLQDPGAALARPLAMIAGAAGPQGFWAGVLAGIAVVGWYRRRRAPALAEALDLLVRPLLGAAALLAAGQTADAALSSLVFLAGAVGFRPGPVPGRAALAGAGAAAAGLALHETMLAPPGPIAGLGVVPALLFALAFWAVARLRRAEAAGGALPEP